MGRTSGKLPLCHHPETYTWEIRLSVHRAVNKATSNSLNASFFPVPALENTDTNTLKQRPCLTNSHRNLALSVYENPKFKSVNTKRKIILKKAQRATSLWGLWTTQSYTTSENSEGTPTTFSNMRAPQPLLPAWDWNSRGHHSGTH